jgi:hypothetical protein
MKQLLEIPELMTDNDKFSREFTNNSVFEGEI